MGMSYPAGRHDSMLASCRGGRPGQPTVTVTVENTSLTKSVTLHGLEAKQGDPPLETGPEAMEDFTGNLFQAQVAAEPQLQPGIHPEYINEGWITEEDVSNRLSQDQMEKLNHGSCSFAWLISFFIYIANCLRDCGRKRLENGKGKKKKGKAEEVPTRWALDFLAEKRGILENKKHRPTNLFDALKLLQQKLLEARPPKPKYKLRIRNIHEEGAQGGAEDPAPEYEAFCNKCRMTAMLSDKEECKLQSDQLLGFKLRHHEAPCKVKKGLRDVHPDNMDDCGSATHWPSHLQHGCDMPLPESSLPLTVVIEAINEVRQKRGELLLHASDEAKGKDSYAKLSTISQKCPAPDKINQRGSFLFRASSTSQDDALHLVDHMQREVGQMEIKLRVDGHHCTICELGQIPDWKEVAEPLQLSNPIIHGSVLRWSAPDLPPDAHFWLLASREDLRHSASRVLAMTRRVDGMVDTELPMEALVRMRLILAVEAVGFATTYLDCDALPVRAALCKLWKATPTVAAAYSPGAGQLLVAGKDLLAARSLGPPIISHVFMTQGAAESQSLKVIKMKPAATEQDLDIIMVSTDALQLSAEDVNLTVISLGRGSSKWQLPGSCLAHSSARQKVNGGDDQDMRDFSSDSAWESTSEMEDDESNSDSGDDESDSMSEGDILSIQDDSAMENSGGLSPLVPQSPASGASDVPSSLQVAIGEMECTDSKEACRAAASRSQAGPEWQTSSVNSPMEVSTCLDDDEQPPPAAECEHSGSIGTGTQSLKRPRDWQLGLEASEGQLQLEPAQWPHSQAAARPASSGHNSEDDGEVPRGGRHILEICGIEASTPKRNVYVYLAQLAPGLGPDAVRWANDVHALAVYPDVSAAELAHAGSREITEGQFWLQPYNKASRHFRNLLPSELEPVKLQPLPTPRRFTEHVLVHASCDEPLSASEELAQGAVVSEAQPGGNQGYVEGSRSSAMLADTERRVRIGSGAVLHNTTDVESSLSQVSGLVNKLATALENCHRGSSHPMIMPLQTQAKEHAAIFHRLLLPACFHFGSYIIKCAEEVEEFADPADFAANAPLLARASARRAKKTELVCKANSALMTDLANLRDKVLASAQVLEREAAKHDRAALGHREIASQLATQIATKQGAAAAAVGGLYINDCTCFLGVPVIAGAHYAIRAGWAALEEQKDDHLSQGRQLSSKALEATELAVSARSEIELNLLAPVEGLLALLTRLAQFLVALHAGLVKCAERARYARGEDDELEAQRLLILKACRSLVAPCNGFLRIRTQCDSRLNQISALQRVPQSTIDRWLAERADITSAAALTQ